MYASLLHTCTRWGIQEGGMALQKVLLWMSHAKPHQWRLLDRYTGIPYMSADPAPFQSELRPFKPTPCTSLPMHACPAYLRQQLQNALPQPTARLRDGQSCQPCWVSKIFMQHITSTEENLAGWQCKIKHSRTSGTSLECGKLVFAPAGVLRACASSATFFLAGDTTMMKL